MDVTQQKQIRVKKYENSPNDGSSSNSQSPGSQQESNENQKSLSSEEDENQQSEESPPIVAAIKTMKFRKNRGSNMQDLIKGKVDKDAFWERNCVYFGGDLRNKFDEEDESDYEASSSGRDQFDSDFDLTDSYPGKRGRKKGQKVKRKIKREGSGRPRGRPKKVKEASEENEEMESNFDKKEEKRTRRERKEKKETKPAAPVKKIYKPLPGKSHDYFTIMKAHIPNKRGPKPKIKKAQSSKSSSEFSAQIKDQAKDQMIED